MSRKAFLLILLGILLLCGPRSISQALESKIYWTDAGMDKIQCANLDGTNVEDVVTGLSRPTGIAFALSSAPSFVKRDTRVDPLGLRPWGVDRIHRHIAPLGPPFGISDFILCEFRLCEKNEK